MKPHHAPITLYFGNGAFNEGFRLFYERYPDNFEGRRTVDLELAEGVITWKANAAPRLEFGADSTIVLVLPSLSVQIALTLQGHEIEPWKLDLELRVGGELELAEGKIRAQLTQLRVVRPEPLPAPEPTAPKLPVAPTPTAPKVAAPKPTTPKFAAPKPTAPKFAAPKFAAPKPTAPKFAAPKPTASTKAPSDSESWLQLIGDAEGEGTPARAPTTVDGGDLDTLDEVLTRQLEPAIVQAIEALGQLGQGLASSNQQRELLDHLRSVVGELLNPKTVEAWRLPLPDPSRLVPDDLHMSISGLDVRAIDDQRYALCVRLGMELGDETWTGPAAPLPPSLDLARADAYIVGLIAEGVPNRVLTQLEGYRFPVKKTRRSGKYSVGIKAKIELENIYFDLSQPDLARVRLHFDIKRSRVVVKDSLGKQKIRLPSTDIEAKAEFTLFEHDRAAKVRIHRIEKLRGKLRRRRLRKVLDPFGAINKAFKSALKRTRPYVNEAIAGLEIRLLELPEQLHVWPGSGEDSPSISLRFPPGGLRTADHLMVIAIEIGPPSGDIEIDTVHFHGRVERSQADEYVELVNRGAVSTDLTSWRLVSDGTSLGRPQRFIFPEGAALGPGERARVYTNQPAADSKGYSFASKVAIWHDEGDVATLFDAHGREVARFAYGDRAD